jgi:hypothetical protein
MTEREFWSRLERAHSLVGECEAALALADVHPLCENLTTSEGAALVARLETVVGKIREVLSKKRPPPRGRRS